VLWAACSLLVVANVINIAADLGGMAAATTLVTGIPPSRWVPIYTLTMAVLLVVSSYRLIARVFKWLTLVLLARPPGMRRRGGMILIGLYLGFVVIQTVSV